MARDAYDFDENDVCDRLAAIGKSVLQSGKAKDALIKSLKVQNLNYLK